MTRTTLHTVFGTGEREVLGGARGDAALDSESLIIRILVLEDTSVCVVPDLFLVLESILLKQGGTYTQHALYAQPVGRPLVTGAGPPVGGGGGGGGGGVVVVVPLPLLVPV